jgi:c-di-AMP phosphodiesterase-like protein
VLVRKIRADAYSIVTTKAQYDKLIDDNFSLLDEIRNVTKGEDFELTLSIGLALGHDDYVKLNDLAASSLDVCLSRGGDQVVVSPFGEKLIFIGGKTEAKTKR